MATKNIAKNQESEIATSMLASAPATETAPAVAIVREHLSKQYDDARSMRGRVKAEAVRVEIERTGKIGKGGNVKGRDSTAWEGTAKTDEQKHAVAFCRAVESLANLEHKLALVRLEIATLAKGGYEADEITGAAFVAPAPAQS